jgi:hypothetical protein
MRQECFSLSVFSFLPMDSVHSSRAASVAILPSALLVERFSLGAWWALPIHQAASIPAYHAHALALGRYAPINPAIRTARYKTPRIASRIEKERA